MVVTSVLPILISTAVLHLHNHHLHEDVHHTVLTTVAVLTMGIDQGQGSLAEAVLWVEAGRILHRTTTEGNLSILADDPRHHQGQGHRIRIEIVEDQEEEMGQLEEVHNYYHCQHQFVNYHYNPHHDIINTVITDNHLSLYSSTIETKVIRGGGTFFCFCFERIFSICLRKPCKRFFFLHMESQTKLHFPGIPPGNSAYLRSKAYL